MSAASLRHFSGPLPRRYARALVELAQAEDRIEACGVEIRCFAQALEALPGALPLLGDHTVALEKRRQVVEEIVKKMALSALVGNFLCLLVAKRRITLLPDIIWAYGQMEDGLRGVVRIVIRAATTPKPELVQRIESRLAQRLKKQVGVQVIVDPEVIGGLSVQVGNIIYDGSLRRDLEVLRGKMLSA